MQDCARQWPTVSVVVPAYNAEATLAACLGSLSRLDYPAFDIIIVDDGSRDATAAIARSFRCRLLRNEKNVGARAARNRGAAEAGGDVLAFTDADCVVPADWLRVAVGTLLSEPVVGVTGGYSHSIHDSFFERLQFNIDEFETASLPDYIEACTTGNFACWLRDFHAIGGFPPGAPWGAEDEELGFLLTRDGRRIRWRRDLKVAHHFRRTLAAFAVQRFLCASAAVQSYMRNPGMYSSVGDFDQAAHAMQLTATGSGAALIIAACALRTHLAVAPIVAIAVAVPLAFVVEAYRPLLERVFVTERSVAKTCMAVLLLELRNLLHLAGSAWGACALDWTRVRISESRQVIRRSIGPADAALPYPTDD
jgi:hypothetical protein